MVNESDEAGMKLAELWNSSCSLLGSQFLMEMVFRAKNVKTLNSHLGKLGWPSELIKKARHAYFFFERLGRNHEQLEQWVKDPYFVSAHFDFPTVPAAEPEVAAFPTTELVSSTAFSFGGWSDDRRDWPFLLRELQLSVDGGTGTLIDYNSFDFSGLEEIKFRKVKDPLDDIILCTPRGRDVICFSAEGNQVVICPETHYGSREIGCGNAFCEIKLGKIAITTYNVVSYPIAEYCDGMPRFYKVVCIQECQEDGLQHDEVKIALRQDMHHGIVNADAGGNFTGVDGLNDMVGGIRFRRIISIEGDITACLDVRYLIRSDLSVMRSYNERNRNPVYLEFGGKEYSVYDRLPKEHFASVGNTMAGLYDIHRRDFMDNGQINTITLEGLCGKTFLENPPEHLLDLFKR